MPRTQISPERKGIYYLGTTLMVVGFLTFGSVFITAALHFGDFSNFEERGRSMMLRAFSGIGLIVLGGVFAGVGRMGAAGSGVILDPEKAREDVEPWSRMTGGVVKDVLDEAGISLGQNKEGAALPFDEQIRRLHQLRQDGMISEEEYLAKKKQILEKA